MIPKEVTSWLMAAASLFALLVLLRLMLTGLITAAGGPESAIGGPIASGAAYAYGE